MAKKKKKKEFVCKYKKAESLQEQGFDVAAVTDSPEGKDYHFKMTKELKKEVGE